MISVIIWDITPNLFPWFDFLRWYGLCWGLGMVLGYQILIRVFKTEGIPIIELDKLTTYLALGAILGARLGHILFYDPVHYWHNPIEILPFRIEPTFEFTGLAGLASHGGIFGALIALLLYTRKYEENFLWLLDRITIGGTALGGFIRLGNLMNSEIIGIPSNQSWAFVFTRIDQIPRHPAQLYEALAYFLLSILFYFIWKSRKFRAKSGFLFGLGMTLIFMQRFLIEFIKENQAPFEQGLMLNMGQMLSIPFIFAGVVMMMWSLRNEQKSTSI